MTETDHGFIDGGFYIGGFFIDWEGFVIQPGPGCIEYAI